MLCHVASCGLLEGDVAEVVHHSTSETYEARKTFVNLQSRAGVSSIAGKGNKVAVSQNQIQNFGSFYSWIRETMLPALFNEGPYGRSLIAGKARVIGGVRLRQICHAPAACPDTRDFLVELYNETCYADKAETKTYWLDNSHSLEVALEHLHHLEEIEWLSMATNSFAAEAFYYNGQTRSFLITSAMWHVKDTGLWRLQNTLGAFPDDMYSSENWISVADSFCIVSLVLFAVTEIVLLRFAAKEGYRDRDRDGGRARGRERARERVASAGRMLLGNSPPIAHEQSILAKLLPGGRAEKAFAQRKSPRSILHPARWRYLCGILLPPGKCCRKHR